MMTDSAYLWHQFAYAVVVVDYNTVVYHRNLKFNNTVALERFNPPVMKSLWLYEFLIRL